uniref:Glycine zipper 2TM domain-containing protein n=1 Tax=Elaeophora elaphi TaxID=1147741 RepID=A0A0R3RMT5_9BILA
MMEDMRKTLVLLIVLLAIVSVDSFGWGYSYYGGQPNQDYGESAAFNAGGAIAGAVLGKKK